LNTTYFSVLPEQYPDKNYPSGLVGINPNGKWLVNRYKVTNGVEIHGYDPIVANDELIISDVPLTATAPTGTKNPTIKSLVRGDYIIDNYAGNYYSVMNPNDESSLVPMTGFEDNSSNTDDWNFYKWDIPLQQEVFTDLKESLVEVFKDGSKQIDLNNVTSIDELISFLNDCIADETSLKEALGSFTIDDDEALAQIPSNQPGRNFMLRAILENRFQDTGADNYILPVNLETKSITAALPLVSVQVTDNLDYEYDPNFFHGDISEERDLESSVRSVSEARAVTTDGYQNYLNTRSTANAEFEANFKEMVKLNVAQKIWAALKDKGKIKSDSDFPLSNVKTEVRLGLAGGGNNVWGNVEMTVGAAVFIQMEITFNVNFDCTNLFGNGLELLKYTGCFAVGPVVFQIECPITFNLDMGIGVETGRDYFAGYTGLYGGKATAGVNYDAIWWWKIPYDYWANAYASGEPWTTTAIYFGPKEKGSFKTAVTGRLTPKLTITPSVALYGIIWGKLPATVGVPVSAKIQTTPLKLSLIGDLDFELRFEAGVGFKILIFDFYKGICNTELAKWRIRLFDRSYNL
jgi:hypothetical protein